MIFGKKERPAEGFPAMASVKLHRWYSGVRRNLAAQSKLNWRWIIVRIIDDSFARARRFDIATDSRALSFTFILSLVPLLAIAFTFFKLFGGLQYFIENTLKPFLEKNFPSGVAGQLNDLIDGFVGNLQTGTLGVVSFVTLMATVVALMMNIEQSFNRIFEARDHRSIFKRIGSYWIMLSATPLFIALSTAKSSELISAFKTGGGVLNQYGIVDFLRTSAGHLFQMTGFGALFIILPERKPRMISALWGAITTHLIFQFLAAINVRYASFVFSNRTNIQLYGSLPLLVLVFLIWVRLVWLGILFGSCICASVDNYIDEQKKRSVQKPWDAPRETILNCVRTLELYVNAFQNQQKPPNQTEAMSQLDLTENELEGHQERLQKLNLIIPMRYLEQECYCATVLALSCRKSPDKLIADLLDIPAFAEVPQNDNFRTEAEELTLVARADRVLAKLRAS
ncbi:MAG: YihY/virulence factor BrkB family protein [Proteobacteria bacterium]|nr:YihY/virulence factor BrkB family protein [Pseudomonadota bacterium]